MYLLIFALFLLAGVVLIYLLDIDSETGFLALLEVMLSGGVIGCLIAIAIPNYQIAIEKAQNIQFFNQIADLKQNALLHYAEHGSWSATVVEKNELPLDLAAIKLNPQGEILAIKKNQQQLGFTPVIAKDQIGTENDIALWLCGYAKARAENLAANSLTTTIPPSQLPNDCVH